MADELIVAPDPVPPTDAEIQAQLAAAQVQADIDAQAPDPVPPTDAEIQAQLAAAERNQAASALAQGYISDSDFSAGRKNAQGQSTLQARRNQPSAADWRVRLQLAAGATYLYKDNADRNGILAPLAATDGVVFPYTPNIDTTYSATYDTTDLVHSNYRGYFYKSSGVGDINVKGVFTAQDTREAGYLLAVIHFFRSVTKMFYGQDAQAGTPPPLVYLSGYGQFQFNQHPCVVSSFSYSLPNDVDYIRANGFNNYGINLLDRKNQSSGPSPSGTLGVVQRLFNSGLGGGSMKENQTASIVNKNVANLTSTNSTYVPTKMEISITLKPIQTRNQVSQQFSVKEFANGGLLRKGFW